MTLHASVEMGTVGENVDDLRTFLHDLQGCPTVQHTQQLRCPRHDLDSGAWFYVEADALAGVARRRCMACGDVTNLLDSAERWTHPPMHACRRCSASLMELAVGLHVDVDVEHNADILRRQVRWIALAARCVDCGLIEGLTDMTVPGIPISEVLRAI